MLAPPAQSTCLTFGNLRAGAAWMNCPPLGVMRVFYLLCQPFSRTFWYYNSGETRSARARRGAGFHQRRVSAEYGHGQLPERRGKTAVRRDSRPHSAVCHATRAGASFRGARRRCGSGRHHRLAGAFRHRPRRRNGGASACSPAAGPPSPVAAPAVASSI